MVKAILVKSFTQHQQTKNQMAALTAKTSGTPPRQDKLEPSTRYGSYHWPAFLKKGNVEISTKLFTVTNFSHAVSIGSALNL